MNENDFTPNLNSTAEERLGMAEAHIAYLQTTLAEARAELAHLRQVGSVLNSKRRHP